MNPPPEHGAPLSWTTYPSRQAGEYHAQASTSLAVTDTLYFIAEGNQISGHFEVSQTGARGHPAVVEVDVVAEYRNEEAIDTVVVSRLAPEEGKQGIGIFRSGEAYSSNHDQSIRFYIHIRLPVLASDSTGRVMIDTFTSDLPLFSHHLHHLASSTYFENIILKTSQCSIRVDALAGGSVSLYTSNAEVRGTIHATKQLHVRTSNAPIAIHAGLLSDRPGNPTHMVVQTSNGHVETDITLSSAPPEDDEQLDAIGAMFDIIVRTSNAPVTVAFSEQPIHTQLTAALGTRNAPARVKLHPAFQGRFELHSSPFFPPRILETNPGDPAGMGRRRRVTRQGRGGVIVGDVAWEAAVPGRRREGSVQVQTSNAPLQLSL